MEHEVSDRNEWFKDVKRLIPEWDGHTPDDAIERIGTLRDILQAETEEGSEK